MYIAHTQSAHPERQHVAYDSNWQQQQNKLIRNVYSGQRQSAHQATKQASQPGSHTGICLIICKVAGNIKEYLHQSIQD